MGACQCRRAGHMPGLAVRGRCLLLRPKASPHLLGTCEVFSCHRPTQRHVQAGAAASGAGGGRRC